MFVLASKWKKRADQRVALLSVCKAHTKKRNVIFGDIVRILSMDEVITITNV